MSDDHGSQPATGSRPSDESRRSRRNVPFGVRRARRGCRHRRRPGRPGDRPLPRARRPPVRDPRGGPTRSAPPGATAGTRWSCSRRAATTPSRACRSPATPTATRAATRWSPTSSSTRATFELPVRLRSRGAVADDRGRRLRPRAATTGASRPTRSSSPPGRSNARACRRSPTSSRPRCSRRTAPPIAPERRARRARSSWSAAATPASRSPRSCPRRTRVHLAVGSRQTPLPQRLLGRDLFWWLTQTGLLDKTRRLAAGSPRCEIATR